MVRSEVRAGLGVHLHLRALLEDTHGKARTWLWLKPSRLGWHDQACLCYVEQLVDCAWVHRDGRDAIALAAAHELFMATDASDETNSVVALDVDDAKDAVENVLINDLGIELGNGRAPVNFLRLDGHSEPLVVDVEAVGVSALGTRAFSLSEGRQCEGVAESRHELLC